MPNYRRNFKGDRWKNKEKGRSVLEKRKQLPVSLCYIFSKSVMPLTTGVSTNVRNLEAGENAYSRGLKVANI